MVRAIGAKHNRQQGFNRQPPSYPAACKIMEGNNGGGARRAAGSAGEVRETLVVLSPAAAIITTPGIAPGVTPMLAPILTALFSGTLTPVIPTSLRSYQRVIMPGAMARRLITRGKRCRHIVARLLVTPVVAMVAIAVPIVTVVARHHIDRVRLRAVIGSRIMAVVTAMSIATAAVYRTTG